MPSDWSLSSIARPSRSSSNPDTCPAPAVRQQPINRPHHQLGRAECAHTRIDSPGRGSKQVGVYVGGDVAFQTAVGNECGVLSSVLGIGQQRCGHTYQYKA